ncbi:CRAL-TRIO domain-containing protein [Polychytrium aggregatum]|nr:CRAL-TRIO domain-containing protein [Polychytrium aggregatum]KAI9190788.1 CRAL-TRIO domain-containing protein [Polychytrium aggregatum]
MDIMRALWLVLEMASEDRLTIMYGVTIINDATGAGWDNLSPGLPKLLISSLQNRFPLRIGRIYVLYPTQIMKLFWTTIKSLLKTKLMFRVVLLENENDASQVLINDFGLECLPEFMGGKVPFDEAQWTEEILLTVLQADSQTKTTVLNRQLSNNRKNVVIAPKPRVNTQIQGLLDQLPPS